MISLRVLLSRLRALLTGPRDAARLSAEVEAHLDLLAAEHLRRGLSRPAAREAARRDFGGVQQVKERYRDQRRLPVVETVIGDARHAVRTFRRTPGFACLCIAILGVGIGANSAMFSLADAVLIRPLPFDEPDRIVMAWELSPSSARRSVGQPTFLDWSEQATSFEAMAAVPVGGGSRTIPSADGTAEQVPGQSVSARFFDVLRVRPIAGRTFAPSDGATPGSRVVVLSEGFWKSRYGADPALIGRSITVDGQPSTVIGIVPADFQLFSQSSIWTLLADRRGPEWRRIRYLNVVARLKPGITMDQARAEMSAIAAGLARVAPDSNTGWGVALEPLDEGVFGDELRLTSFVLVAVVGLVLLMACANIANLLLARGVARAREFAVRSAVGAGRARIASQLLTENLMLAAVGGAAGLLLCWLILRLVAVAIPRDALPPGVVLALDVRVVVFSFLVTCATGLVFGVLPAWHASRLSLNGALSRGGRVVVIGPGLLRRAIVTGEVAVAVVVLTGAVLLLRTLAELNGVDPGYRARNVITMATALPLSSTPQQKREFYRAAEEQVLAVPGVRLAAWGTTLPLDGRILGQGFEILGEPPPGDGNPQVAAYHMVSPRYFDVLGIPIIKGRRFSDADTDLTASVCIVSQTFVDRYLQGRNAIGAHVRFPPITLPPSQPVPWEIVGVVQEVKETPSETEPTLQIYVPIVQNAWTTGTLVVQANSAPAGLVPAIRAAVGRVDKSQALTRVLTMEDVARQSSAWFRFRAQMVTAFGALALTLASTGIFGVIAFSVRQRTRELGVRMALGATAADVLRLVLFGGFRMTAYGLVLGVLGAAVLSRSLSTMLFGVTPLDPITFVMVPCMLTVAAILAAAAPAMKAARVDPAVTFRSEG